MNRYFTPCLVILIIMTLFGCSNRELKHNASQTGEVRLTISAAASLDGALKEIKTDFEKKNKHITLLFNLGGSGALKQQILQGAPTDIFISAAKEQFNELLDKKLIDKQNQIDLLGNQLVLITNKQNPSPLKDFAGLKKDKIEKIAIGTPESVPAGKYALQTLHHLNLWDAVQKKVVQTKDVRQVLTYVETNNVDAGIVYMTDVKISDKVKVVQVASEESHDPIIYPAGVMNSTTHRKEAFLFYQYLKSKTAGTIFEKYGFKVLD
jgi:molybdate transport system substrate-binding protein